MGISRATFDAGAARRRAGPDAARSGAARQDDVKGQAEFTKTPAEYLSATYLAKLSEQGKALQTQHAMWLDKIERELGVQRQFVLAIWGRETAFGAHRSSHYAVKALATQAYLGRRKDMFRTELLHALKMLQDGVRTRETMTASWAGAMGLTQFMPSEFYTVAYDLDGDGRKDIWGSVADALGSAANQLRAKGWVPNQSWGYEVRLPKGVSCLAEGPDNAKPLREWVKLGVVRAVGDFPGPRAGPAGLRSDACRRATAQRSWRSRISWSSSATTCPTSTRCSSATSATASPAAATSRRLGPTSGSCPPRASRRSRSKLQGLGYAVAKIDGKAGMNTRSLIGAYQKANSLKVDCWPTEAAADPRARQGAGEGRRSRQRRHGARPGGNSGRAARTLGDYTRLRGCAVVALALAVLRSRRVAGAEPPSAAEARRLHREALAGRASARHLATPVRARNRRLHPRS